MKISRNWLSTYIDLDLSDEDLSAVLTALGLEVEGMEKIESIRGGLRGVVVGHVLEAEKHPNADRLSLTRVDIGGDDVLQIVCGAPNVAAGQKVLVATVGTTLYGEDGAPFKIKKGKIRGSLSEGMICAEDELSLGDDHTGIIVLPEHVAVGTRASDYYEVETDVVYDIALTPNRSDATSHIGVAKDLLAYARTHLNFTESLRLPDLSSYAQDNDTGRIRLRVDNVEACPRYSGVCISNVRVGPSPAWLQTRLQSIGVRPINNIVDITNFVLHEWGQPLHAFDADRINGQEVVVRTLPDGTKFTTLDEQERSLHAEDLMICNGDMEGMCIGGVFGGIHSGVTETTTNIFLESAHFNAGWIRRTSMRHLLRTDAAVCFEKGSDPNVTVVALKRAALLIRDLAGGRISSEIMDAYPTPIDPVEVRLRFHRLNQLVGQDISRKKALEILTAMDMRIIDESEDAVVVGVPTNKADVLREVDVIEEVLRIYGYDTVPIPSKVQSTIEQQTESAAFSIRRTLATTLVSSGFSEMMNLSLQSASNYEDIMPDWQEQLVFIHNTSNVHLNILRRDMLFSALETVEHNQNRQQGDLRLFEFGHNYVLEDDQSRETEYLTLVMTGRAAAESWTTDQRSDVDFYSVKAMVHQMLVRLGIASYQREEISGDNRFGYGLTYRRGRDELVRFGAVARVVLEKLGIRAAVFYAEFTMASLLQTQAKRTVTVSEVSRFPSMRRDLAIVLDESVPFAEIERIAHKAKKDALKQINLFDVYRNAEQLGANKKSYAVSFLFENDERTLRDEEVDRVMDRLIRDFESQLQAQIRK